jgi:hyaluronate lyase
MKVISMILSFILAVTLGIYPESYQPVSDDAELDFVVISDIHMEGNNPDRFRDFPKVLLDINGSARKNDALVMCGDNTMNGQHIEYTFLTLSLKLFNNIRNNLLVLGNHEIFTEQNGYEKGLKKFLSYGRFIMGEKYEKPYYSREIDGFTFIMMSTEADMGVTAYISEEQIEWLDETLTSATQNGKPAFVFCHFPINGTVETRWPSGLMGEQSDEVFAVLKKHKNVFFFSGHLHNAVDYSGIRQIDGVTFVDVPSVLSDHSVGSTPSRGIGYCVEIHDGKAELRPRNFISGEWIEGLSVTVELAQL